MIILIIIIMMNIMVILIREDQGRSSDLDADKITQATQLLQLSHQFLPCGVWSMVIRRYFCLFGGGGGGGDKGVFWKSKKASNMEPLVIVTC